MKGKLKRIIDRLLRRSVVSLGRVRDRAIFREGNEEIALVVDADAMRMIPRIEDARQKILQAVSAGEEQQREAALYFAEVIFGKKQAEELSAFYMGDGASVAAACGRYFTDFLAKKITRAQVKHEKAA